MGASLRGRARAQGSDIDLTVFTQLDDFKKRGGRHVLPGKDLRSFGQMAKAIRRVDPLGTFSIELFTKLGLGGLPLQGAPLHPTNELRKNAHDRGVTFADLISPITFWIECGKIEMRVAPAYSGIRALLAESLSIQDGGHPLPFVRVQIE